MKAFRRIIKFLKPLFKSVTIVVSTATTMTLFGAQFLMAQVNYIGPKPHSPTALSKGTLFVKSGGTGTICSLTAPCDIWNAAIKAKAGDVVFLRGGIYNFNKNLRFLNVGTAAAPVIYENYPGEKVVFDGSQLAKGTNYYIGVSGNFIHVRGIEIRYMPVQGIWVVGSDNLLEGIYSHHNGLSGIQITTKGDNTEGSRNIIRNSISSYNSGAGLFDDRYSNGGNSDGIAISTGSYNRIENCLLDHNSDDGIDTWRSINTYVGYNISHSNGIAYGNGNGVKAGGPLPSANTYVENNLAFSNKTRGFTSNGGINVRFLRNTSWNNAMAAYAFDTDTIVTKNIGVSNVIKLTSSNQELDNSWQRLGVISFMSTDFNSVNFLKPTLNGGFTDIGALANAEIYRASDAPDLIITNISYANGIYSSTVRNQGTAAIPSGVVIGVGYFVDGAWKTWGGVWGPLAIGQSVTIGTKGSPYVIPSGSHTIKAHVDDQNKIVEILDTNNILSIPFSN